MSDEGGLLVDEVSERPLDAVTSYMQQHCTRSRAHEWVLARFPIITWLPTYTRALLRADLVAGVTVGVVLIPQGVAYAMLAELPPIYGLYSSLLPLPIYASMATSKHMSIGPFALVSLLVADSVSEVVDPAEDPAVYASAVMLLSFMIGILHCLMAALNLGIIVRLISDSVLSGFTSAAAILISASQLKHLLGMPIPRSPLPQTFVYILTHVTHINPLAVAVGVSGVFLLQSFKKLNKRMCASVPLPEQLILLALATAFTWLFGLEEDTDDAERDVPPPECFNASSSAAAAAAAAAAGFNCSATDGWSGGWLGAGAANASAPGAPPPHRTFSLPTVGEVPSGLPAFSPPPFSFDLVVAMLQPALVVGLFSFILSISIVRTFALKYEYATDSNQELFALGASNVLGSFFLSYPIAGSLSRSALVSTSSGAQCTPLHGLFTALLVLLVLLFLTPTFRPMPRACLASIVFMAVKSLFDTARAKFLRRVKFADFVAWVASFIATLLLGVQLGIGIGVFTSMVLIVLRSARPNFAVLGRLPRTKVFRDVRRYPEAASIPGVVTFRFDSSLHFANKDFFSASLRSAINEWGPQHPQGLTAVVVDFSSVNDIDASALRMLTDLLKELQERQLRLLLAACKGPVRDVFERSGFLEQISHSSLCTSLADAVKYGARLHRVRLGGGLVEDGLELSAASPKRGEGGGGGGGGGGSFRALQVDVRETRESARAARRSSEGADGPDGPTSTRSADSDTSLHDSTDDSAHGSESGLKQRLDAADAAPPSRGPAHAAATSSTLDEAPIAAEEEIDINDDDL